MKRKKKVEVTGVRKHNWDEVRRVRLGNIKLERIRRMAECIAPKYTPIQSAWDAAERIITILDQAEAKYRRKHKLGKP